MKLDRTKCCSELYGESGKLTSEASCLSASRGHVSLNKPGSFGNDACESHVSVKVGHYSMGFAVRSVTLRLFSLRSGLFDSWFLCFGYDSPTSLAPSIHNTSERTSICFALSLLASAVQNALDMAVTAACQAKADQGSEDCREGVYNSECMAKVVGQDEAEEAGKEAEGV